MLTSIYDLKYWWEGAYEANAGLETAFPDTRTLQLRTYAVTPDPPPGLGDRLSGLRNP